MPQRGALDLSPPTGKADKSTHSPPNNSQSLVPVEMETGK
jgi:hypothetical protein